MIGTYKAFTSDLRRVRGADPRTRLIVRSMQAQQGKANLWAAALFICAVPAMSARANDWIYIVRSPDASTTFYKQLHSVITRDHKRRALILYDYTQVQQDPDTLLEHRSTVVVALADCASYKLATVQSTDYSDNMAKGKVLRETAAIPDEALRYVSVARASGSLDDAVMKSLCSRKKALI
jgi:hypothetical protein